MAILFENLILKHNSVVKWTSDFIIHNNTGKDAKTMSLSIIKRKLWKKCYISSSLSGHFV